MNKKTYNKKITIIIGKYSIFIKHFNLILKKNENIILLLNNNIYKLNYLNKIKQAKIYSINTNEIEFKILKILINNNFKKIDNLIINTTKPHKIKPIEQIEYMEWVKQIQVNINITFILIKHLIPFLKKSNTPTINFIIHKNQKNLKSFWSITESINKTLFTLMQIITDEYKNIKNIKINFFSSENTRITYNKQNYPYKKTNNLKNTTTIINTYIYILNKKIKNKIIRT